MATLAPLPRTVATDKGHYSWYYLIWFIVLTLIVWVVLVAINPSWLQRDNGGKHGGHHGKGGCDVDLGKAFVWALLIALGICVLIWLIRYWGTEGAM